MSAVNFSETLAKAGDKGVDAALVSHMIERMEIVVIPFDSAHAVAAAALRPSTRHKGVSFADRACIALGKLRELPVLTGDTKWSSLDLDLDIDIRQIR